MNPELSGVPQLRDLLESAASLADVCVFPVPTQSRIDFSIVASDLAKAVNHRNEAGNSNK
jgi:hypothetical protein